MTAPPGRTSVRSHIRGRGSFLSGLFPSGTFFSRVVDCCDSSFPSFLRLFSPLGLLGRYFSYAHVRPFAAAPGHSFSIISCAVEWQMAQSGSGFSSDQKLHRKHIQQPQCFQLSFQLALWGSPACLGPRYLMPGRPPTSWRNMGEWIHAPVDSRNDGNKTLTTENLKDRRPRTI